MCQIWFQVPGYSSELHTKTFSVPNHLHCEPVLLKLEFAEIVCNHRTAVFIVTFCCTVALSSPASLFCD